MKQKILIVSATYGSNTDAPKTDSLFAIAPDEPRKMAEAIKQGLAIVEFACDFAFYNNYMNEINSHADEILAMAEGKRESFTAFDKTYTISEWDLDADMPASEDNEPLKHGQTLYIKYDSYGKEAIGLSRHYHDGELAIMVPFMTDEKSVCLGITYYFPFRAKGEVGFLVNEAGEEIGGPYKYARVLSGRFFTVVDSEGTANIINSEGHIVVAGIQRSWAANGFIDYDKDGKSGFIEVDTEICSPLFDELDAIFMDKDIRVKKDGEWGYLAEDFTFLPETEVEKDDEVHDRIYWGGYGY